MSSTTMYMTEKGFAKIEASLARLQLKRLDLAEQLADSCGGGDNIDNTEYLLLREEAANIQDRIWELEDILRYAELIECGQADGKVHLGNTVAIQSNDEPIQTYTIVGRMEADPSVGFISNESPLGHALIQREVGEIISVEIPDGELSVKILAVT